MKFQLFSRLVRVGLIRRERQHFFRMVAANGKTVAQSEGYKNAGDRTQTVLQIKRTASVATLEDLG